MTLSIDSLAVLPFVSPAIFAAGAAATSIPIIIHLLNKRRFRVVIWAAMDFLLAAQRRNARKLKFQRWLLLALRVLAILLLAAAVAQFTLSSRVMGNLMGGARVAVIVLDDSYSMGFGRGTTSAFDSAKKLATGYLSSLNSGDKVLVIRTSEAAAAGSAKLSPDPKSLIPQLAAAQVSDAGTDLTTALSAAASAIKGDVDISRNRTVIVLTDLSNSSLPSDKTTAAASREQLQKAAAAVKELATLRIIDLGSPDQLNMGITELKTVRPITVTGKMTDLACTVFNATDRPALDVPLTLYVDGQIVATQKIAKIEPGKERTVTLAHTFAAPGRHWVEAKLPPDLLPADDTRRLIVNVQRDIPVLLVQGTPPDPTTLRTGSTDYLWIAYGLSAEGKSVSEFSVQVMPTLSFESTPLKNFQVVAMADTEAPTSARAKDLAEFVSEGGLLMIFPGPRTAPERWNTVLGESGAKLLPATFGQLEKAGGKGIEEIGSGITFDPAGYTHPVLEEFGAEEKSGHDTGFAKLLTQQYYQLGVPQDGSSDVVLRFAKKDAAAQGSAAVVTKQVGRGHVVVFASTADTTWSAFGPHPTFLPFMHKLAYHLLTGEADVSTLAIGQKINLPVDVGSPGWWTAPRNGKVNVVMEKEKDKDKENRVRLTSGPLTVAGFYAPEGGKPTVAVNVDAPAEVDIRHMPAARMASALAIDPADIFTNPKTLDIARAVQNQNTGGGSIGRNLLAAALLVFLLETLLARLFSVYR